MGCNSSSTQQAQKEHAPPLISALEQKLIEAVRLKKERESFKEQKQTFNSLVLQASLVWLCAGGGDTSPTCQRLLAAQHSPPHLRPHSARPASDNITTTHYYGVGICDNEY